MFKRSFLYLLLLASPALSGPLQSERYFNNTGGLVDHYSPILIPTKSATDIQNVQLDQRGQLLKRSGYINNNTTDLTASTVTGVGYHQSTTGTSFLAVVVGTNVYTTGNTYGGSYTNVTSTITLTANINNLAQFTSYKDWGVFCNESDTPIKVKSSSAFAIVKVATTAKTCESFNNYLLFGNTSELGTTYGSRIRWSDLGDIDTYPANNYIDIEPDDGDSIVAIKRYQNNLYVFKKHSIYEIIITGGAGAEAFIYRPIARNMGAYAKMSVKVVESRGIVFLGQSGVYLFDGANFDFISDSIQRKLDGLNRSRYADAVGVVHTGKNQYLLSVSDGVDTKNKTMLVWDYVQQAWSTYSGIQANALTEAEDSSGNVLLFSGDYNGDIYKQDVGTTDKPNGVATAISAFYATPNLQFGSPEISKTFKYLYVFSKATSTSTITVDVAYSYLDTYSDTYTVNVGEAGAVWNVAVWNTDVWPGIATKVSRLELNRPGRAIRLKFSENSTNELGILGWVVVYSADDFRGD